MVKKYFLLVAVGFTACLVACTSGTKRMDEKLIERIESDARFSQVEEMAETLISSGLMAGNSYGEVWIRDLNSFIELASKVNGKEKTADALLMFFKFQEEDGNIPDGYIPKDQGNVGYKYRMSDLAPDYISHKNTVETDQETSLIQAVYKYIQATGDIDFLNKTIRGKTVISRMDDALQYLLNDRFNTEYGLLWGATTIDWGDVQPEHVWGVELDSTSHPAIDIYDNAMFIIAIKNYLSLITDKEKINYWKKIQDEISNNTRKHLWDGNEHKYKPHIYLEKGSPFPSSFDEDKIYYHGGTFTAIEAGLLTEEEIQISYQKMLENVEKSGAPSIGLTVYPPYPNGMFLNKALSEYSYQNGGDWTWFGGRMIQSLIEHEMYNEAYLSILPMLDLVIKHDDFYEWWTIDGKPGGSGNFRGAAGVLWKSIQMFKERING